LAFLHALPPPMSPFQAKPMNTGAGKTMLNRTKNRWLVKSKRHEYSRLNFDWQ
jgi:hypothetical protein